MKKSIFSVAVYIVILYLVVSLISCNKENPIVPPPPVTEDTTDEYEWRAVPEGLGLNAEIFVADTSHIYLFYNNGTCYRYDGDKIFEPVKFNDTRFYVWEASSMDNKNIYFTGFTNYSVNYAPVTIKKMLNGNEIQTFISLKDSTPDWINTLVTGDNDIWYGKAYQPYIYHLSSNYFVKYELDSGLVFNYLWKDKYNNIYAFGNFYPGKLDDGEVMYSYKFNGTNFERMSKDTLLDAQFLFPCGSDLLTKHLLADKLLYFSGTNWIPYIINSRMAIYKVGGNSKDSLICFGFEPDPSPNYGFGVYIWKGNKWKKEKKLAKLIPDGGYEGVYQVKIDIVEDHVYFPADFGNKMYLIIGKKIKKQKNL